MQGIRPARIADHAFADADRRRSPVLLGDHSSGQHEIEHHRFGPEPADGGRAARHTMRGRLYFRNIDGVHRGAAEHGFKGVRSTRL